MKSPIANRMGNAEIRNLLSQVGFASLPAPFLLAGMEGKFLDYILHQIEDLIGKGALTKVKRRNEQIEGFIIAYQDEWDTKELGVKTFKIPYFLASGRESRKTKKELIESLLAEMEDVYLFIRIPSWEQETNEVLKEAGFVAVDSLITFGGEISNLDLRILQDREWLTRSALPKIEVSWAEAVDLPSVFYISDNSFFRSRFHNDPMISFKRARAIYRSWLEASFNEGSLIVARVDDKPVGFVSFEIDNSIEEVLGFATGRVGLIAVLRDFRSLGIGRRLILTASLILQGRGAKYITVGTQMENRPAIRLYRSLGLKVIDLKISLRRWLF